MVRELRARARLYDVEVVCIVIRVFCLLFLAIVACTAVPRILCHRDEQEGNNVVMSEPRAGTSQRSTIVL